MPATLSHEQIQNFLHNVTQGRPAETEALLIATPEITQELLRTSGIFFTDNSGRTFNCTAYEYAHWTKDAEMCRILERHMDDETRSQICCRITVKDAKGLIYFQNGKKHCTTHFDFNPLITALNNHDDGEKLIIKHQDQYHSAQRNAANAQLDEEKAKLNVEKARHDVKKTLDDVQKAQSNEKKAQRDIEKAQRDMEKAQRDKEKAQSDVAKAQLDVAEAQRNIPAYVPPNCLQQELRNIDEKNTSQLKEFSNTLENKKRLLLQELLDTSNKEGILLIDKILQHVPEDSLLYGLVNHLKQKTMSLPSDIRDPIYMELLDVMKNLNNPGMDKITLINSFEKNCQHYVDSYAAKEYIDLNCNSKDSDKLAEAMGSLVAFAIVFAILATISFMLFAPVANIMFGSLFTFFAVLTALPVLVLLIGGVCSLLVACWSNGANNIKVNSIDNAVEEVAECLSKSSPADLGFFSKVSAVVPDDIDECSSNPEGELSENGWIPSMG